MYASWHASTADLLCPHVPVSVIKQVALLVSHERAGLVIMASGRGRCADGVGPCGPVSAVGQVKGFGVLHFASAFRSPPTLLPHTLRDVPGSRAGLQLP